MKTIYLFRHSVPQRIPGVANGELPLSERGWTDAAAFGASLGLEKGNLVFTSPYRRAWETAQALGEQVVTDVRLVERETGNREAFTKALWAGQYVDPELRGPGGESFSQVRRRMEAALEDILPQVPEGGSAVVVSHAGAICAYLQGFCAVEVTDPDRKARKITFQNTPVWEGPIGTPACFTLSFGDGGVEAVSYTEPDGKRSHRREALL